MIFRKLKYRRESKRNQWSEEVLKNVQLKNLKYILNYAYENSRFYRHLWEDHNVKPSADVNCIEDLEKLPIIDRRTIADNYSDLISQDLERRPFNNKIAGTGITASSSFDHSFRIFYNESANEFYEANWHRIFKSLGYSLGDKLAYYWYKPFKEGLVDKVGLRKRRFISHKSSLERQVKKLERMKPDVTYYLSSVLFLLANKERDISISPNLIVTHGGILSDSMRKTIESSFNAPVYDVYGSTEFKTMAWECKKREGYHINSDSIVMEFLDREGRPVSEGDRGRVVVTGLRNTTFPLIRYCTGDVAISAEGQCSCGRSLPLVKSFEGRSDNFICRQEGQAISPRKILDELYEDGILKLKVKQETKSNFRVTVELRSDFDRRETFSNIRENLKETINDSIKIEIEERELDISGRGKFPMVDSAVSCDPL